ncbi:MAG TPA: hypothetical protein VGU20_04770 [Stellaceae bacterium]|nr:hypothetical protein [Stellaceae bacterium]
MVIDAAVAAAMLTVAAIVVPARSLPAPPAPSLLFFDTWPDDCANLHGQAQTGMRGAFGIFAAAAALAGGILALQPGAGSVSIHSLLVTIVGVVGTVLVGQQGAALWERGAVNRRAEWLRQAEAAKYRVTTTAPTTASSESAVSPSNEPGAEPKPRADPNFWQKLVRKDSWK